MVEVGCVGFEDVKPGELQPDRLNRSAQLTVIKRPGSAPFHLVTYGKAFPPRRRQSRRLGGAFGPELMKDIRSRTALRVRAWSVWDV